MHTTNKKTAAKRINKAVDTLKITATKANTFALKSTEIIVLEGISFAGKWQNVTAKALKGGLKLAAAQQDIILDTLEATKDKAAKGFKRSKALLTK